MKGTITVLICALLLLFACGSNSLRMIDLRVDTKPIADIYFDSFYVGTGSADIMVFSDKIPNYLEMRDIITGDVLTRLLLFEIPSLERILLQYDTGDWRDKRLQTLRDYIISTDAYPDSLNGQKRPPELVPAAGHGNE